MRTDPSIIVVIWPNPYARGNYISMTSQQFKTLLTPPNIGKSSQDAAILFNTRFQTFDDLDELESLVLDAQQRNDSLQSKVLSII